MLKKNWFIVFIVVLIALVIPYKAHAAVKLSPAKITLTAGESKKLKVTGTKKKVKWQSSNKKAAIVKNGVVKAKSKGQATITALIGKKKYQCQVTVKAQAKKMKIKMTIGSHVIHATLYNNAAAQKLYKSLPKTYPMMNLYGREMCYRMGEGSLPVKEAKDQSYKVGDISYWPPAGSLVILYKQNGEVFEQQPIGHTDDDLSFLKGMKDTSVKWEKA